eukprot:scaffold20656_cov66-Phaeocystis_antarctica.AAC.2
MLLYMLLACIAATVSGSALAAGGRRALGTCTHYEPAPWCNNNCFHTPPNCPSPYCTCAAWAAQTSPSPPPPPLSSCTHYESIRAGNTDAWCNYNCFHSSPYCPSSYCPCDAWGAQTSPPPLVLLAGAAADPLPVVDISVIVAPTPPPPSTPQPPCPVRAVINLGTAAAFCLLTKAGITSTGATSVDGNTGTSPITVKSITGFALQYDIMPFSDNTFATSSLVSGKVYAADLAIPTPASYDSSHL